MIGQTLSHFKITAKLGEGGMGAVYRATDTKLGREVAVKVLPEAFTTDSDRMARFEREARVLASLNHPSIAAIHDLAEAKGVHFLVLELVEGVTLASLLARGPLPPDRALQIAAQITEALEAAHARGVVHRDLKPANIMVGAEDLIKVLDFGLAKPTAPEATDAGISHSPTLTAPMTEAGVIMGTAAYMSPEQARGQAVDKQADIWAFGVILWEMLAGRRLFEGETVSDVLAAVLRADIDWNALPRATPSTVHRLLARCLEREPRQRLHDIADARIEVEAAAKEPPTDESQEPGSRRSDSPAKTTLRAGGLLAVGALAALLIAYMVGRGDRFPEDTLFLSLDLPTSQPLDADPHFPKFTLSPDGRTLVYRAIASDSSASVLVARSLDRQESRVLPGTENASQPFFSPDGEWIGFHSDGELRKVPLQGGLVTSLCSLPRMRGATWAEDGSIYMGAQGRGILKLSPGDSEPRAITQPDKEAGEFAHIWPQALPGNRQLLLTVNPESLRHAENRFAVLSLDSGEIRHVHEGGIYARYLPSGHLLYGLLGQALAIPFELETLEVTGEARPVLDDVRMASPVETSAALVEVAANGSMIYAQGYRDPTPKELTWIDRAGNTRPILEERRPYESPALSPNGEQVAMTIREGLDANLWLFDLVGDSLTRLTTHKDHYSTIWSPDGRQLAFASNRAGRWQVFTMPADGSAEARQLTHSELGAFPSAWSGDGGEILVDWRTPDRRLDVWRVPVSGGDPEPVISSTGFDGQASFSPDGSWIAYASNESGPFEVYVQAYPGLGRKWQISSGGGSTPQWSRSGDEIFYWDYPSGGQWVAVPVDTTDGFYAGEPVTAFEGPFQTPEFAERNYDFDATADRFLALREVETEEKETRLVFVTNWLGHLERLVP